MASPDQLAESLTKLYVSDIPPTATSEQLRECVEKVGAVDEVVVKHGTGQQGGHFGFVWTTRDVAAKLMSMTHDIDGVVIPAPVLARRQHRHARDAKSVVDARVTPNKIFVGGLSNDTKLEDYRVATAPPLPHQSSHPMSSPATLSSLTLRVSMAQQEANAGVPPRAL